MDSMPTDPEPIYGELTNVLDKLPPPLHPTEMLHFVNETDADDEEFDQELLAAETIRIAEWRHEYAGNPALRLAVRAWASGAVTRKKDAARMAGVTPEYFSQLTGPQGSIILKALADKVEEQIHDQTIATSKLVQTVSREAMTIARDVMNFSQSESLKLKAAQDFMDRSLDLSKTQKHVSLAFSLDGEDAKELAKGLVEAAEIEGKFPHAIEGDYVTVDLTNSDELKSLNASTGHPDS